MVSMPMDETAMSTTIVVVITITIKRTAKEEIIINLQLTMHKM